MSLPSRGEIFSQLIEHLRRAQESAATLGHLYRDDGGATAKTMALGWLTVSEAMKEMQTNVVKLATKGRLN